MNTLRKYAEELEQALLLLDRDHAEKILSEAIKHGSPIEIAGQLISTSLKSIGEAWEEGRIALSQEYMSGIICEELIEKILPTTSSDRISQPKMAIAVFEDYHMLGKRIVLSGLRASGYNLIDLGGGVTSEQIIEAVEKEDIKILLLSALMLPSALRIKELRQKLGNTDIKIIVGGAPFRLDNELWKDVGADAVGRDSSDAIDIVARMMEELK